MPIDLKGSVAIITGGGSGIGRASAQAFARRGARLIIADIDEERADQVAAELGEVAVGKRCDVTDVNDLDAARKLALSQFGRVDLVMNNVGVLAVGKPEDIPLRAWQRAIDINLMSVVRGLSVFLPGLLEQGSGHIVNTASTAGLLPYAYDSLPYTATKHAIVGLSESLAIYLRPRGIGVSCFCPAGVITNITEQMTFYGDAQRPTGPDFGVVDAKTAGELVAEGVSSGRFLIVTTNAIHDELRAQGDDLEAYLNHLIRQYTSGETK